MLRIHNMNLVSPEIEEYCRSISGKPSDLCEALAKETRELLPNHRMLIGTLEASFLRVLISAFQVQRVLEFGTFTGYSALAMAELLPKNGELITLDIDPETTSIGKKYWNQSPHASKIKLILGEANQSLSQIEGNFDLVFVDADKENYSLYVDWALQRLNPRGLIVCDNMLWSGRVLNPASDDTASASLSRLNERIRGRKDLCCSLIPLRDGMLLISRS